MVALGDRVLTALATALGLAPDHFVPLFDHSVATLRPLHYRWARVVVAPAVSVGRPRPRWWLWLWWALFNKKLPAMAEPACH